MLSCYYLVKADYKAFRSAFTVFIRRTFYHGNSVYPCRIWLETNSMPFLLFRRDHLRSTSGIIFAVRDHLGSNLGIISGLGIICGAVQDTAAVHNLAKQKPATVGDVRTLPGFLRYYRQYIQDFSRIAKPQYDLMAGPDLLASNHRVSWTQSNITTERLDMLIHRLTSSCDCIPRLQNCLCFTRTPIKRDWEPYCIKNRVAS